MDSVKQRLRSRVIGGSRASRQDLSNVVGSISKEQVELEADRIVSRTSDSVTKVNAERIGGGFGGGV